MKIFRVFTIVSAIFFALMAAGSGLAAEGPMKGLTAAISAKGITWNMPDIADTPLMMVLMNRGDTTIDLSALKSRIILDGKPVTDRILRTFFESGPFNQRLAPGKDIQSGFVLGLIIKKKGFHTIVWKGPAFVSNEVRLLVK
jgi:hypothetical protein